MSDFPDNNSSLVSVVIPTYYRKDRLCRAIQSIKNQTYDNIEIVVVDDSGEKFAQFVVAEYDLQYIAQEKNCGPNRARTVGAQTATGDYIQFLDDDDQLKPQKLEKQVKYLETHIDVGVVCCGGEYTTGGRFVPDFPEGEPLRTAITFGLFGCNTATMLIRQSLLEEILPWPDSPGFDDPWLKTELAKRSGFGKIKQSLVIIERGYDSRINSEGELRGMEQYLDKYRLLYSQFPREVKQKAECKYYERKASWLLEQQIWSSGAIIAYWKAAAVAPNNRLPRYGRIIASILGRPGVKLTENIFKIMNNIPLLG